MVSGFGVESKKPDKAIIYCRVSSQRQKNEGNGLESQEQRCRHYAKERGYPVDDSAVFKDSFSGGGDYRNRPALQALFKYVDDNPHVSFVVIIDDLSRFARDVTAHFKLRKDLEARSVSLECTNFNFEDTPEGELIEAMIAVQNQYHRANNTRQVVQKQKSRLESGYWAFGAKKGYVMIKHALHNGKLSVPKKPEAEYLKVAIEGFATGRFKYKVDACRYLVEKGFWNKQKPERYIDKFTAILKDIFYAGYIEYPMWGVARREGHHEGIISLEIFEAVQKLLNQETSGKRPRKDMSEDFPLRGLIVCADCCQHMTGAWSQGRTKKYAYYFCQNRDCAKYAKVCSKADVEKEYDKLLKSSKLRTEIEGLVKAVFEKEWEREVKNLKQVELTLVADRVHKEHQLQELVSMLCTTKNPTVMKAYENQIEKLSEEIDELPDKPISAEELNVPYQTALSKCQRMLQSPYAVWHSVGVDEKQKLFHFIFQSKLPYDKTHGYQTGKNLSYVRVFEEFVTTNSQQVDSRGIEPRTHPCHGCVLPLYYEP